MTKLSKFLNRLIFLEEVINELCLGATGENLGDLKELSIMTPEILEKD